MLLLDKLYHIKLLTINDDSMFTATVTFNNNHEILKGHFPGNPIIPGACIIQIAGEILSVHVGKDLSLVKSKKIKFTNTINPLVNNTVDFCFTITRQTGADEEIDIACNINVQSSETVFAKMSAEYSNKMDC